MQSATVDRQRVGGQAPPAGRPLPPTAASPREDGFTRFLRRAWSGAETPGIVKRIARRYLRRGIADPTGSVHLEQIAR